MSDCPRKPNEVRIRRRLFGCVGMQAASKSEHCSDSTLLSQNLFGLREGTQVNPNIVWIAPLLNRNSFGLAGFGLARLYCTDTFPPRHSHDIRRDFLARAAARPRSPRHPQEQKPRPAQAGLRVPLPHQRVLRHGEVPHLPVLRHGEVPHQRVLRHGKGFHCSSERWVRNKLFCFSFSSVNQLKKRFLEKKRRFLDFLFLEKNRFLKLLLGPFAEF